MPYAIEVCGLKKSYGKKQVLNDAGFTARAGSMIAIAGENGCGKSTMLSILAGVMKPDGGSIEYFGCDALKVRGAFATYTGFVPQENPLYESLSVADNLSLWRGRDGYGRGELLYQFELTDIYKKKVRTLSGGMKRRLAIACAVYSKPKILFMDEPTSALDLYYQNTIREWMRGCCDSGGTIIFATHSIEELKMSDTVLRMKNGVLYDVTEELDTGGMSKWLTILTQ